MIYVSLSVEKKIREKHGVTIKEVHECFQNRTGCLVMDERERHRTWPPSEWFIAETDRRRVLKVVFIVEDDESIPVKTAYEPSNREEEIYADHCRWNTTREEFRA